MVNAVVVNASFIFKKIVEYFNHFIFGKHFIICAASILSIRLHSLYSIKAIRLHSSKSSIKAIRVLFKSYANFTAI